MSAPPSRPERVELRLGGWGRQQGGSFAQRQLSGLLVLPFAPAVLLALVHLYWVALSWAVVSVAAVAAFLRRRPAADVGAVADDAGLHWHTDREQSIEWSSMDWVELGRTQPGGTLLAGLGLNTGNVRTGEQFMVTVVSQGVPYEVTPVRGAFAARRKAFGEGVAALARAHGVRVRVLTLGWGREDVNREDVRLG